jgi:hypothetical protein
MPDAIDTRELAAAYATKPNIVPDPSSAATAGPTPLRTITALKARATAIGATTTNPHLLSGAGSAKPDSAGHPGGLAA